MSVRRDAAPADAPLDARARLALFHGTTVLAEEAVRIPDVDLTFEKLVRSGCTSLTINAAGLRPLKLKEMGCKEPAELRRLGFDALHLVNEAYCAELCAAFGAQAVTDAFVVEPADAVAVAGTAAVDTLNLSVETLLQLCAGSSTEAAAVIAQTPGGVLDTVSASTLLDTGLRAPKLRELGFTLLDVTRLVGATTPLVAKFGFTV